MTMETIFILSNVLVLPFWLLIIFAPTWSWTRRIMQTPWVVAPNAILYALLVLPQSLSLFTELANPRLAQLAALLGTPNGATIGWLHFLTFDLLTGRWAYLESRERGYSPWLMGPVLFFIFMLGPFGCLLYLLVRTFVKPAA